MAIAPTRKLRYLLGVALGSLALLVPMASTAQAATLYRAKFCGAITSGGITSVTLRPGQACTFLPVSVRSLWPIWQVTASGHGSVCVGVLPYPPGWPKASSRPLSPTGGNPATDPPRDPFDGQPPHPDFPGYPYTCQPYSQNMSAGEQWAGAWFAHNGFGAVYGQPVIINFSTATVKTLPGRDSTWGWMNYYA